MDTLQFVADQPSPPSPLSLSGRGGVGRILVRTLPSPREGEGLGVRVAQNGKVKLLILKPCLGKISA